MQKCKLAYIGLIHSRSSGQRTMIVTTSKRITRTRSSSSLAAVHLLMTAHFVAATGMLLILWLFERDDIFGKHRWFARIREAHPVKP